MTKRLYLAVAISALAIVLFLSQPLMPIWNMFASEQDALDVASKHVWPKDCYEVREVNFEVLEKAKLDAGGTGEFYDQCDKTIEPKAYGKIGSSAPYGVYWCRVGEYHVEMTVTDLRQHTDQGLPSFWCSYFVQAKPFEATGSHTSSFEY